MTEGVKGLAGATHSLEGVPLAGQRGTRGRGIAAGSVKRRSDDGRGGGFEAHAARHATTKLLTNA